MAAVLLVAALGQASGSDLMGSAPAGAETATGVTTVAGGTGGSSPRGTSVDGQALAVTADRVLFGYGVVRELDTTSDVLRTVAGTGGPLIASPPSEIPAAEMAVVAVAVAYDVDEAAYISSFGRVWRVASDGIARHVAGGADMGDPDGKQARDVHLGGASALAVDGTGRVYVGGANRVVRFGPDGVVETVAGGGFAAPYDGAPAAQVRVSAQALAFAPDGSLNIATTNIVWRLDPAGVLHAVAGDDAAWQVVDGVPATESAVRPCGIAFDPGGNLFVGDRMNSRVRRVDTHGIITTIAGNGTYANAGDGGPAADATVASPCGVGVGDNSLYVATRNAVRRIGPDGLIDTAAGNGHVSFSGDGGPAGLAQLNAPADVAVAPDGTLFIADTGNNRVRAVGPDGTISTFAGDGSLSRTDGVPATSTGVRDPSAVAFHDGTLYVSESDRVSAVGPDGTIRTVATTTFVSGLPYPAPQWVYIPPPLGIPFVNDIDVADDGTLYLQGTAQTVRLTPDGRVELVGGRGGGGTLGTPSTAGDVDDGPALAIEYAAADGVDVVGDAVYVADSTRVRKIAGGVMTTVAGSGVRDDAGDGGRARLAAARGIRGLTTLPDDEVAFVTDHRVRLVSSGTTHALAGGPIPGFADSTDLGAARFAAPQGMSARPDGTIFVADMGNNRIRRVVGRPAPIGGRRVSFDNVSLAAVQSNTEVRETYTGTVAGAGLVGTIDIKHYVGRCGGSGQSTFVIKDVDGSKLSGHLAPIYDSYGTILRRGFVVTSGNNRFAGATGYGYFTGSDQGACGPDAFLGTLNFDLRLP